MKTIPFSEVSDVGLFLFREFSKTKRELELSLGEQEDQIKTLQTQLELKDKTIHTLKGAQKALIDEVCMNFLERLS